MHAAVSQDEVLSPNSSANSDVGLLDALPESSSVHVQRTYRLYKRRFVGVFALMFLNIAAGLSWPWFGPIASASQSLLQPISSRV